MKVLKDRSFPWKPGDGVAIVISDQTGEDRSANELADMMDDIAEVAAKHDFKLRKWGEQWAVAGGDATDILKDVVQQLVFESLARRRDDS